MAHSTHGAGAPLAARELPALLRRLHAAIAGRREALDDLNVFPVPDGDTGTNMTLTVRAGLEALEAARPAPPEELARAVTRGALRGARGNSGVILSQVIRAVVEVTTGHETVDAKLFTSALVRARDLAYEAVANPVEGTILTVLGAAAEAATEAVERGEDLIGTSTAVCRATAEAVERTREQLDVLRSAGVVDAGARGLEVLIAAVHGHISGQDPDVEVDAPRRHGPRHETGGCRMTLSQPFEVQYLLDATDDAAAPLRSRLEQLGDSVIVVAAGGLLNVHVHTGRVGPAVEAGLTYGTPSDIEVTHFGDQIAALQAHRERPALAAVAVLSGDGLRAIARELGAAVVDGAAGALPSVDDLLHAIGSTLASRVLVLPGHRNVIAAASSAAALASEHGARVDVIDEAVSPPSVLAALAVLDLDGDPDAVVDDLRSAAAAVRAGEVVAAVRDADTPVGAVERGQSLAVADGDVVGATRGPLDALEQVCVALDVVDAEIVTLLVGADVDEEERAAAIGVVAELTEAELDVVDAGQRPSRYWVGVE